jgi:hypothetical protein
MQLFPLATKVTTVRQISAKNALNLGLACPKSAVTSIKTPHKKPTFCVFFGAASLRGLNAFPIASQTAKGSAIRVNPELDACGLGVV